MEKVGGSGIFEIHIDSKNVGNIFGATTPKWGWEKSEPIYISQGNHQLKLHDLTGFEGRVGMIVFSRDKSIDLPKSAAEVSSFVYELTCAETLVDTDCYDIVICGAGIPGICAALTAARNGLNTALIQDRPVVGGNNSSEVRVWLGGKTNFEPFPGIGNVVSELDQKKRAHYGKDNQGDIYEDDKKWSFF